MSEFEWEDPPETTRRVYRRHDTIARQLRGRQGEWAKVAVCRSDPGARNLANRVRSGLTVAYLPAGDFEAVVREVDGEFRVYARYLGEGRDA